MELNQGFESSLKDTYISSSNLNVKMEKNYLKDVVLVKDDDNAVDGSPNMIKVYSKGAEEF